MFAVFLTGDIFMIPLDQLNVQKEGRTGGRAGGRGAPGRLYNFMSFSFALKPYYI